LGIGKRRDGSRPMRQTASTITRPFPFNARQGEHPVSEVDGDRSRWT